MPTHNDEVMGRARALLARQHAAKELAESAKPNCVYCGAKYDLARLLEAGYRHCTHRSCIAKWRNEQVVEQGLHLILQPKVGFTWTRDTRDLTAGKSSGRS